MTSRPKVLSIVLAGGEGKRLMPLTLDRAKPAVPFGGTMRLIDFVLSNMVNSGLLQVAVLTQYKSHSLDRHITLTWRMSNLIGDYVTPVPAQQRLGPHWYQGSADAIYQSMNLIRDANPDYVVVFGADNIYRMDIDQMLRSHIDSGLGATVAGIRVPRSEASAFGIIDAAAAARKRRAGHRIPPRSNRRAAAIRPRTYGTAQVENRVPRAQSKLSRASTRPMKPSWNRSSCSRLLRASRRTRWTTSPTLAARKRSLARSPNATTAASSSGAASGQGSAVSR